MVVWVPTVLIHAEEADNASENVIHYGDTERGTEGWWEGEAEEGEGGGR